MNEPSEVPHCAGRQAVAHARTPMVLRGDEWVCPACGETATSALDVAAFIIEEQHKAGRTITLEQLQCLLYLVQGAHLMFWDEPAFNDPIIAAP